MALRAGMIVAAALGVLLAVAAPSAHAQELDMRRITRFEATSDCIGDPRTPLCALETFFACALRRDLFLCALVGIPRLSFGGYPHPPVVPSHDEYILRKQYTIRAWDKFYVDRNLPPEPNPDWYQPGFVALDLVKRTCYTDGQCYPKDGWEHFTAYVKPVEGVWHMASWAGDSDPEEPMPMGDDDPEKSMPMDK